MAPNTQHHPTTQLYAVCFVETEEEKILVALPGLEPGLSALRGRRVNQLHHNAKSHIRRRMFSPAHSQSIASQPPELKRSEPLLEHSCEARTRREQRPSGL